MSTERGMGEKETNRGTDVVGGGDDDGVAYVNGNVYTVNASQPWVEAFIVSSKTHIFTHVGSTDDITALARSRNLIAHDLQGRFIMPGIHDAHVHFYHAALTSTSEIALSEDQKIVKNVVEELRQKETGGCACKYMGAYEDWLVGGRFAIPGFHRKELDEIWPERPVLIRGGAGHGAFLNSEALKRTGYEINSTGDVNDEQGAFYMRDEEGNLTGEMAEMALSKVLIGLPKPKPAHVKRVLKLAQGLLHRAGVTSCQEASANTSLLHTLKEMEQEHSLKLDLYTHIVYAPDWIGGETTESLHALLDNAATYRSKHVDTRFVKIILDGVPLAPYYTHAGLLDDGQVEKSKLTILNVHEAVRKYDALGMTVKIHCTGHGATRLTFDAFEAARKANPNGPRHEIAHCSGVHDADLSRFAKLNVTAEMSPAFFFVHPVTAASGGLMDWNFPKMLGAQAHITLGSDWGAGDSPDLLPHMAGIVEAVGAGDRAVGGAKICRMLTLAGAEAVNKQDQTGSIEVGKRANFIAVNKDLSRGDFEDAHVLATWFEGEIVYEKP